MIYWIAFKRGEYIQSISPAFKSVISTTPLRFFAYRFENFNEAMEIGFNNGYTVEKVRE